MQPVRRAAAVLAAFLVLGLGGGARADEFRLELRGGGASEASAKVARASVIQPKEGSWE